HVSAGIHVVRAELGDVERDDADAVKLDREVTHRLVVKLLLHVGEDDDGLPARAGLVKELGGLDQPTSDVGVRGPLASLYRLSELRDFFAERFLLSVDLYRIFGQAHLRDYVLLGETTTLDC